MFRPKIGFRFAVDKGVATNTSLASMQAALQQLNVNTKQVGGFPMHSIAALLLDNKKSYGEIRFVSTRSSSDGYQEVNLNPVSRAKFYGYGFGFTGTRKIINTKRFIVGPTFGYDLMWYRLDFLSADYNNVPIKNVVQNQAAYTPTTLYDANMTMHLAVDAEVRFRIIREFQTGARFGYQFPLGTSKQWRLNDGTISDLATYRANMFFLQINLMYFLSKY